MAENKDPAKMRVREGNFAKAKEILVEYESGSDHSLPMGWAVRFAAQIVADSKKAAKCSPS